MAVDVSARMVAALRRGSGSALTEEEAREILETAAILVRQVLDEDNLPPARIEEDAAVLTAAFMADRPGGPIARERAADVDVTYASGSRLMSPVRGSGALGMLKPWRMHGAGSITPA